jgi:hypothetical protein
VAYVLRDANHRAVHHRRIRATFINRYALSDRVLSGPELFGHGFVDDGDRRAVVPVSVVERATLQQRDAQRGEEVGGNHVEQDRRPGLYLFR